MAWYDFDGESAYDSSLENDIYTDRRKEFQQAINENRNLYSLWQQDTANRKSKRLPTLTLPEFVHELLKGSPEVVDLRPDYAKPVLDRYDPTSDEYSKWKDTMNMWEEEDTARAEADVFMNQLMQKHLSSFNEANKKAKYDKIIKNFSSKYKQDVDTTPIENKYFI